MCRRLRGRAPNADIDRIGLRKKTSKNIVVTFFDDEMCFRQIAGRVRSSADTLRFGDFQHCGAVDLTGLQFLKCNVCL